jgi:hypothetical protein
VVCIARGGLEQGQTAPRPDGFSSPVNLPQLDIDAIGQGRGVPADPDRPRFATSNPPAEAARLRQFIDLIFSILDFIDQVSAVDAGSNPGIPAARRK